MSDEVFGGTFACGAVCDEGVCIGQASSVLAVVMLAVAVPLALAALLAFAGVNVAFLLGVRACAAIGNAADVAARATPICNPTAKWKARSANRTRAKDKTRTGLAYSIHPSLSKYYATEA